MARLGGMREEREWWMDATLAMELDSGSAPFPSSSLNADTSSIVGASRISFWGFGVASVPLLLSFARHFAVDAEIVRAFDTSLTMASSFLTDSSPFVLKYVLTHFVFFLV